MILPVTSSMNIVDAIYTAVLRSLDESNIPTGSIISALSTIMDIVDDVGGTLGAIFGILLAALMTALKSFRSSLGPQARIIDIFAPALLQAVESLKLHTGARVGDRTVMDVLLPFSEALAKEKDLGIALAFAESAADRTRHLKPSFGRASYVGDAGNAMAPDPGAWAFKEIVKGMYEGCKK